VDESIERRNGRRFHIALPLLLRWTDSESHYDSGHCVNIGQGGMFVLAATTPLLGGEVEIEFVLPPFSSVPRPTRLHCVGRVSRIETCYQLKGFAVAGRFVNQLAAKTSECLTANESPDTGF
jgi:PilZ domain